MDMGLSTAFAFFQSLQPLQQPQGDGKTEVTASEIPG